MPKPARSPYVTVGGPKQPAIPGPVLGVSFDALVADEQAAKDLEGLVVAANRERRERKTQDKEEAHSLRVLNAAVGARFILKVAPAGLRDLKGKTLRLKDTYWMGRGAKRKLKVLLKYGRSKYVEVEPWQIDFLEDVIAQRMGAG